MYFKTVIFCHSVWLNHHQHREPTLFICRPSQTSIWTESIVLAFLFLFGFVLLEGQCFELYVWLNHHHHRKLTLFVCRGHSQTLKLVFELSQLRRLTVLAFAWVIKSPKLFRLLWMLLSFQRIQCCCHSMVFMMSVIYRHAIHPPSPIFNLKMLIHQSESHISRRAFKSTPTTINIVVNLNAETGNDSTLSLFDLLLFVLIVGFYNL